MSLHVYMSNQCVGISTIKLTSLLQRSQICHMCLVEGDVLINMQQKGFFGRHTNASAVLRTVRIVQQH